MNSCRDADQCPISVPSQSKRKPERKKVVVKAGRTDRKTEAVDREQPPRLPFTVVGIGASAGGLEALMELFQTVPKDHGLAFVIVQHLPPERESMLAEILSRHTSMPVLQVKEGMKPKPGHAYIIAPGRTLTLHRGIFKLGASVKQSSHRRPVDDFFRSLAEEQRERAIAIILSGMGSNGTAGAQVIKAVGGLCIAQNPESAKFPAMPRALIEAHLADFILRPSEMPDMVLRYSSPPYARG